jgi:adenylate kinase family enzyme
VNQVIVVTGPAGAGKTAVSEALCERFDRMMHVSVDTLRHWVKAGYRHPWLDEPQAAEQVLLGIRNATAVTRESIAARYAVVIDDTVFADEAAVYRERLQGIACNVHFVVLLPSLEVALARDASRDYSIPERTRAHHEMFTRQRAEGVLPGAVVDSTEDADAAKTADRVMDVVASGEALFIEATSD